MFQINSNKNLIKGNEKIFDSFVNGVYPVIGPNKLYLKSFINQHQLKFVKGLYSQDELWAFHCAEKLDSISFIKDITYIYFMNSGSTIFNKKKIYQYVKRHKIKLFLRIKLFIQEYSLVG